MSYKSEDQRKAERRDAARHEQYVRQKRIAGHAGVEISSSAVRIKWQFTLLNDDLECHFCADHGDFHDMSVEIVINEPYVTKVWHCEACDSGATGMFRRYVIHEQPGP